MKTTYDTPEYYQKMNAWWRAANYLSVGQIYLKDNPLLRRPIEEKDLKVNPIGHRSYFRQSRCHCSSSGR